MLMRAFLMNVGKPIADSPVAKIKEKAAELKAANAREANTNADGEAQERHQRG